MSVGIYNISIEIALSLTPPSCFLSASLAAMVMSVHLFKAAGNEQYRVAAGYEDGYVKMWAVRDNHAELQWSQRKHSESSECSETRAASCLFCSCRPARTSHGDCTICRSAIHCLCCCR